MTPLLIFFFGVKPRSLCYEIVTILFRAEALESLQKLLN